MTPLELLLSKLPDAKRSGKDWVACCPAHDDERPSLSVAEGGGGRALVHCHAGCRTEAIIAALGLEMADLMPQNGRPPPRKKPPAAKPRGDRRSSPLYPTPREAIAALEPKHGPCPATWSYYDAYGEEVGRVLRWDLAGGKVMRPVSRTAGGWVVGGMPAPRPLYRLPDLLDRPAERVYVAEGEKCADALATLGLLATTSPHGSESASKADWSPLAGREVVILPDHDAPGDRYAADVADILARMSAKVRIVRLVDAWPGLPDGGDIADIVALGEDRESILAKLAKLVDEAEPEPQPVPAGKRRGNASRNGQKSTARPLSGEPPPGSIDPATGRLILSTERTLPTAEAYVQQFHQHPEGITLRYYAGLLMSWEGNRYVELEDDALRNRLLPWLHAAVRMTYDAQAEKWIAEDFPANPHTMKAALESVKTHTHLSKSTVSPSWLDGNPDRPNPCEIIPCRSTLLHLPTMQQIAPSPAFFAVNALDYDHEPDAPEPRQWQSFLSQLFKDDLQSWDLLQEWFGYCLTGDTSQHKMLLIVGPRRSGKGTIARVLTRLVGAGNVCGPTTSSLAGPFGLQPLIGKSLAIVSDARFSGENIQTVIERLLCISGEDTLTIDRKHMTSVTMKLPTRFVFLTNELPRLTDTSGALAGRFMMLRLTESYYGREDKALAARLLTELPGILNWSIGGWRQLRERGHFIQPTSVEDALRDMEDLSSPVGAFVRERCEIGGGLRVRIDDLYQAWKQWCEADGRVSVTTKQTFGRDLMAAAPGVVTRCGTNGVRFYQGIALKGVLA